MGEAAEEEWAGRDTVPEAPARDLDWAAEEWGVVVARPVLEAGAEQAQAAEVCGMQAEDRVAAEAVEREEEQEPGQGLAAQAEDRVAVLLAEPEQVTAAE